MADTLNESPTTSVAPVSVDISIAGWCLLLVAVWELLVGRGAAVFGLYQNLGASGALAYLVDSGQVATTMVAVLSLTIAATGLVRLCTDDRFAALPVRVVLLFASPFALPIIAVSIFRPVQPQFVRVGYMGVVVVVAFLMLLVALHRIGGPKRRAAVVLGAVPLLQAVGLLSGGFAMSAPESFIGYMAHHAASLAQALYLASPLLLFPWLVPGGLRGFVRQPNLMAAAVALLTAALATGVTVLFGDPLLLGLAAFRAFGLSLDLPIAPALYVLSSAVTALVGASLLLPGGGRVRTSDERRVGLGVLLIAMVGLHQFHPYRFAVLLAGFIYVARGLVGPTLESIPRSVTDESGEPVS